MQRRLSYQSTRAPEELLRSLERTVADLPTGGRFRPPHVSKIRADIQPPHFLLECERDHRDLFGPVCEGTVTGRASGSAIQATIRRSRASWFIPIIILLLTVVGWLRGGGPTVVSVILLAAAIPVTVGWPMLISLFSTSNHEAEADALDAVLRRAIEQAESGAAVA